MNIKMIATDLDGTLLDKSHALTEKNLAALKRCVDAGIVLVVATGRSYSSITPDVLAIPGIRYIISANGARVFDTASEKNLLEKNLSAEAIARAWPLITDKSIMCEVYWNGWPHVSEICNDNLREYGVPDSFAEYTSDARVPVKDIVEFTEAHIGEIETINFNYANETVKKYIFDFLSGGDGYAFSASLPFNYTIGVKDSSKYSAVNFICEYLGIDSSSVIAFGDGENDLDMIKHAGIGVAMANAPAVVREQADFVTLDCDDSGVAYAIDRFIPV